MKPSVLVAALVAVATVTLLLPALSAAPAATPLPAYTVHAPIFIAGDAGFTAANGVISGSGTPADPYVISGWSINASSANGIDIQNTTASFTIRAVDVHWGKIGGYAGVRFLNVANGVLDTSVVSNNTPGFQVQDSTNIGVANSTFEGNGIDASSTSTFSVTGSNISFVRSQWGDYGVRLTNVSGGVISRNTMWNVAAGVYAIAAPSTVGSNLRETTIDSNAIHTAQYGIVINGSWDLKVLHNDMIATNPPNYYIGVAIWGPSASGVVIAQNNISRFAYGFQLIDVSEAYLIDNNVSYSLVETIDGPGSTPPAQVIGNTFWHNAYGFHGNFQGSLILHDAFVNTSPMSIGGSAIWNDSYPVGGNYWSDYTGVDGCSGPAQNVCTGSDGIGDTPYVISASNSDHYPLMSMPGPLDYPPAAMFTTSSNSPYAPATVSFDASGSWDLETSASALQVRWDWNGDGVWDTGWGATKTAVHTFTSPGPANGTYTIRLEVMDGAGLRSNTTQIVQVLAPPPAPVSLAIAANPTSGPLPLTVSFTSTVGGGVPPYAYTWTFGDGSTSTLANTVHIYVTGGNFTVWCTVADSASGGAGSNFVYVNVTPAAVNLSVTAPTQFVATSDGITAPFSSSVTGGTPPYNYTWDFGDGARSYLASPVHTYANPGAYTVTLTVRDSVGRTATQQFTVLVPAPTGPPPPSYTILYLAIGLPTAVSVVFGALWLLERRKARRPPAAP